MRIIVSILLFSGFAIAWFSHDKELATEKPYQQPPEAVSLSITPQGIWINDHHLELPSQQHLFTFLGEPDRVEKEEKHSFMEAFGVDGEPPTSYEVLLYRHYYIYDSLGLIFASKYAEYDDPQPVSMMVFYGNERVFDHKAPPEFEPVKTFAGICSINGVPLLDDHALLPDSIHHNMRQFELFNTSFGATSYASNIDGIYSLENSPHIQLYLDESHSRKASYMEVSF